MHTTHRTESRVNFQSTAALRTRFRRPAHTCREAELIAEMVDKNLQTTEPATAADGRL